MKLTKEQQQEIADLQAQKIKQKVTSPELEKYFDTPVLDHGFVRVVDYMGDDSSIVQSLEFIWKRNKKVSTDEGLIKYLIGIGLHHLRCEIKYHVKLPIYLVNG